MKKALAIVLSVLFVLAAFAACGGQDTPTTTAAEGTTLEDASTTAPTADDDTVITIGASSTPHAEILEQVKETLAAEGYTLEIVTYDDYVLPNTALADGTIDANYFQHTPYLNDFNEKNSTDLISAASIHYEPFGIYGKDITDLETIADGATIIIPADSSNETRALLLLEQEGLITLPENASAAAGVTSLDIVDNGGYNVVTVQADTVAAQLNNADAGTIAVINGNYAIAAGLKIADALATEDVTGDAAQTYSNIIAVRNGDQDSAKIKALVEALQTETIKTYIADTYEGAVVATF